MYDILKLVGADVARVSCLAADGGLVAEGWAALALEAGVRSQESIPFLDCLHPHFFFVEGREMVVSRSVSALLALRRARGLPNEFDCDGLSAYRDTGLVLPPLTIVRNVFQIPALSELAKKEAGYVLRYRGLGGEAVQPFRSTEDLFDELRRAVERGLGSENYAGIICTVSGGADSAALLSTICEVVEPGRVRALTCRMPGFEGEIERARKVVARCGVEIQVYPADDVHPEAIIDAFVQSHANLVLDPVVPVITAMFKSCIGDRPADARVIVVEGQGADTVLTGLPHNAVMAVYRRALWPIFRLVSLLLPSPNEWLQLNFRLGYRMVKVARILAECNWRRALLRSLEFDRAACPALYDRLDRMLQAMFEASGDRHKAIMLFFLHILQAREAQKYQMLPQGVDVLLPFMDLAFMRRCFATPTSFFLRGTRRKIPINERVRERFPGLFSSERTTPFAVRYRFGDAERVGGSGKQGDGTYARLKAYSIAQLGKLIVNRC